MFPVELDGITLWSLFLYASFIILIELTLLWFLTAQGQERAVVDYGTPLSISHGFILLLSALSMAVSFLIMQDQLLVAAQFNMSPYYATRGGLGEYNEWFTLHQVLNRMTRFPSRSDRLCISRVTAAGSGRKQWGHGRNGLHRVDPRDLWVSGHAGQ